MATEQATTPNNNHKCTCNKQIAELKKQVTELKAEIEILRLVLRSVK